MNRADSKSDERIIADAKRSRRFGWRSYLCFGLVLMGLAVLSAYAVWSSLTGAELRAEIEAIRAAGDPVFLEDLATNATPEGRQAYELLAKADESFWEIEEQTGLRDKLLDLSWNEEEARYDAWTPEYIAATREFLAAQAPAHELVRQAQALHRFDFPLVESIGKGTGCFMGIGSYFIPADMLLSKELLLAGYDGDADLFVRKADELFALAESIRHVPDSGAYFGRERSLGMVCWELERSLPRLELSEAQLQHLDRELRIAEERLRVRPAVVGWSVWKSSQFRAMAEGKISVDEVYDWRDDLTWSDTWELRVNAQLQQTHAGMLRYSRRYADIIDTPGPAGDAAMDALASEIRQLPERFQWMGIHAYEMEFKRSSGLSARQLLTSTRVALRIDRHYRRTGKLPEALSEITDETLPEVSPCYFSGAELTYFPEETAFALFDEQHDEENRWPTWFAVDYATSSGSANQ